MAGTKVTTCPVAQNVNGPSSILIQNSTGAIVGTVVTTTPTNTQLLYTCGANDGQLKQLTVVSDDTSARILNFYGSPDSGTTKNWLFSVNIPTLSGTNGVAAMVDCMASAVVAGLCTDQGGKQVMPLVGAYRIYVGSQTQVTTAKGIMVTAIGEDF